MLCLLRPVPPPHVILFDMSDERPMPIPIGFLFKKKKKKKSMIFSALCGGSVTIKDVDSCVVDVYIGMP